MKIHPHEKVLEELLLSLPEREQNVLFHLARCAYCRARLYYLPRPQEVPAAGEATGAYALALERTRGRVESWARAVEQERDEAPDLFLELMSGPAERWEEILGSDPRFHSWGLFELLIERSQEATSRDAVWAEHLGLFALGLSERLDAARYGAELIEDLRARAWACIGNARRTRSDLRAAEEAFGNAFRHLEKGTEDGLERAILLDLLGSLRGPGLPAAGDGGRDGEPGAGPGGGRLPPSRRERSGHEVRGPG